MNHAIYCRTYVAVDGRQRFVLLSWVLLRKRRLLTMTVENALDFFFRILRETDRRSMNCKLEWIPPRFQFNNSRVSTSK